MKYFFQFPIVLLIFVSCGNCTDNEQNQNETGVDCGGDCPPCETCSDGIKNQDEVEVDCGGVCPLCPIEYPVTGTFGQNVLNNPDTIFLAQQTYSFRAIIPEQSSLLVHFNLVSGAIWFYHPTNNEGWSISTYAGGLQTFEALQKTCDVSVMFNDPVIINVSYFENSSTITKSRVIVVS